MDFFSVEHLLKILSDNVLLIFLLITLVLLYNYYTANYGVFKEKGIPHLKPTLIVGNIGQRVFLKISFHDFNIWMYEQFKGQPYGGYFEGRRPLLMVKDPELIKEIMIKQFDHFVDRNTFVTRSPEYLKKMMISLQGKEWKNVRGSLTSAFSSGKLRGMENLLRECGKQMIEFLDNRKDPDEGMEMKDFIGRYTLEVIGSCAFGLDCSSLKDPDAKFMKTAAKFSEVSLFQRSLLFFSILFFPDLLKYLPVSGINLEAVEYLKNVAVETRKLREESVENVRNDFMQLMLDLADKEKKEGVKDKIMTDDVIYGQAIIFLFAGYETTSTLLSFAYYLLATNQDIQTKLRKELLEISENDNSKSLYDALNEVPLLEKVLLETLRIYPPVSRVDRKCTKPLTLPGTNVDLKVGDVVVIPIAGILHDPEYYPEPEKFDPERFSSEEKQNRPSHLYLPFGLGPRNCIGMRFAMMSAKYAVFYLLRNFSLEVCEKTESPIKISKRSFLLKAENGIWLKVKPLPK